MANVERTCWIDDFGPLPVHRPQSVAEVGALVRRAAADGQAVYPLGGRTMLDLGLPPTKPGFAIDLTALDQVIDYPARDMTITVQAGITIAKLQEVLATENQRLPIDVPQPERATLGGAIATNASGPRRYGFGTLRDYVIGISVVNEEGQEVKAGGRVVKNVAGYDLCKLYTGSLGTLGIITQVTLKVRPRSDWQMVCHCFCGEEELESLSERLCNSRIRPVCVDLVNPAAARQTLDSPLPKWSILVGYEGNEEQAAWQQKQLQVELGPLEAAAIWVTGGSPRHVYQNQADFQLLSASHVGFKANLRPSQAPQFCRLASGLKAQVLTQAHAGNGIVFGHFIGDLTLDLAKPMLTTLFDAAVAAEGNVVLTRCPPAWKRELPVWGRLRGDAGLMRTVKEKLDPRGLFNPGRFVDGI